MRYCRFLAPAGPSRPAAPACGEIVEREDGFWIERLLAADPLQPDSQQGAQQTSQQTKPEASFTPLRLAEVKLLPPVSPSKIVCVGRNYRDHAAELGHEVPREPLLFLKPPSALIACREPILLPTQPCFAQMRVDYEGELALVIGRRASQLEPEDDLWSYLHGYTIANDVTARDLQKTDGQWTRAKGFDTFCPVGPMVNCDLSQLAGPGLALTTRHNGRLVQQGHTRDLIFSIPQLLCSITAVMTLVPGDLVLTGTPAGVSGIQRKDTVEIELTGAGRLSNSVLERASEKP